MIGKSNAELGFSSTPMKRVAIVGAGVAGCSCATGLLDAGGCDVTLFDLGSRGPGETCAC